jgi:hypothetical protein
MDLYYDTHFSRINSFNIKINAPSLRYLQLKDIFVQVQCPLLQTLSICFETDVDADDSSFVKPRHLFSMLKRSSNLEELELTGMLPAPAVVSWPNRHIILPKLRIIILKETAMEANVALLSRITLPSLSSVNVSYEARCALLETDDEARALFPSIFAQLAPFFSRKTPNELCFSINRVLRTTIKILLNSNFPSEHSSTINVSVDTEATQKPALSIHCAYIKISLVQYLELFIACTQYMQVDTITCLDLSLGSPFTECQFDLVARALLPFTLAHTFRVTSFDIQLVEILGLEDEGGRPLVLPNLRTLEIVFEDFVHPKKRVKKVYFPRLIRGIIKALKLRAPMSGGIKLVRLAGYRPAVRSPSGKSLWDDLLKCAIDLVEEIVDECTCIG